MKRCSKCGRTYTDETLNFCLEDGEWLVVSDEPDAGALHDTDATREAPTRTQIHTTDRTAILPTDAAAGANPRSSDDRATGSPTILNKRLATVGLVILLAAGGFIGYRYLASGGEQISSVAVLPFQNRSDDPDTDYLSDGLAESLIFRLSKLPGLKVSPTSSAIRYKGKETYVETIGRELGVDAVVTGRLMKRGDNLNIMVELVDVRDNKSVWGEQYERKMSDLLTTQREIAATIAEKLQLKLSAVSEKGLNRHYTENNEAYQHYLRGRHHWNKRTKESIEQGIAHFQSAIELDPGFALAYVGIADSYSVMPAYGYMSPKEANPRSITASRRALEIDPDLPQAHGSYGTALSNQYRWAESETELKRALELDPNIAESHFRYSIEVLAPMGRIDQAIEETKRALDLEPLSIPISSNLAGLYLYARNNEAALEQALKAYNLERDHATATFWLGWAYIANGKNQEVIELCERLLPSQPESQDLLQMAAFAYAKSGRPEETRRIIKQLEEMSKRQYVVAYRIATLHAVLGDNDRAYMELERSYHDHEWDVIRLKVDPFVDTLRGDPRFAELVRKLNFPDRNDEPRPGT